MTLDLTADGHSQRSPGPIRVRRFVASFIIFSLVWYDPQVAYCIACKTLERQSSGPRLESLSSGHRAVLCHQPTMQPSSLNRGSSSSGSSLSLLSQRLNSLTAIVLERERVVQLGLKPSASTDAQVVRGLTSLRGEIVRGREQRRLERQVGLSVGGGTKKKQQQQRPAEDAGDALEGLAKRYINLLDLMSRDETGRRQVMELGLPDELVVQEPATQQQGGSSNDSNAGVSFQLIPPTPSMEDPPVLGDDAAGFPARSQASAKSHAESSAPFRDDPYDHGDERATSGSTWTSAATGDRRPYSDHAMDEESAVGGGDERDDQQLLQGQRSMMDGE